MASAIQSGRNRSSVDSFFSTAASSGGGGGVAGRRAVSVAATGVDLDRVSEQAAE